MCGIVANTGFENTKEMLVQGLKNLEYRGYDSAGLAIFNSNGFDVVKVKGFVAGLEKKKIGNDKERIISGIGHTRWATHGEPSEVNAHPHVDMDNTLAVVHNGIIENHAALREKLAAEGYKFKTQTDTEVIPNLLHFLLKTTDDHRHAFIEMANLIQGSYALVAIFKDKPETIYAARKSSPLVVGVSSTASAMASDIAALPKECKDVYFPEDGEIIELEGNKYQVFNLDEQPLMRELEKLTITQEEFNKQGYEHFMLKEIFEAPEAVRGSIAGRIKFDRDRVMLGGLSNKEEELKSIDRLLIIACGTSYYASMTAEYFIEEHCNIPVEVRYASEFRYHDEPISENTAVVAVSQSGETADTLEAIRKAKSMGLLTIGVVNVVGSSISRETDTGVYTHAGPEIGVASTKAFVSQLLCLYMLGMHVGNIRDIAIVRELLKVPELMEEVLGDVGSIEKLAQNIVQYTSCVFLGRKYMYPLALEGSLKLKEVSYIHAEGYPAGEMKHGPLALIDKDFPTIALAPDNEVYDKTVSNIQEVHARSGPIYSITDTGSSELKAISQQVIVTPESPDFVQPFVVSVVLQLLAYHSGVKLGYNVDRPRNLAKSVTVE